MKFMVLVRVPLGPLRPPPFLAPTPQTAHRSHVGVFPSGAFFFLFTGCYFFLSSFFKILDSQERCKNSTESLCVFITHIPTVHAHFYKPFESQMPTWWHSAALYVSCVHPKNKAVLFQKCTAVKTRKWTLTQYCHLTHSPCTDSQLTPRCPSQQQETLAWLRVFLRASHGSV